MAGPRRSHTDLPIHLALPTANDREHGRIGHQLKRLCEPLKFDACVGEAARALGGTARACHYQEGSLVVIEGRRWP